MKSLIGSFIGLVLSVSVGAESLLEGRVSLSSGQPAVGVQVRLFDLTDLRRFVGTTTDEAGHFALPLRAFSTARGTALPSDFALGQNYPNPFNPSTIIPYQLPTSAHVRLEVFNLLGQRLATLVDAERSAGVHMAQWDATDAAGQAVGAGVYIYRLSVGEQTESRRMVLVDGQAGIPAETPLGSVRSAVEGAVEVDGAVYGLTVSGAGLIPYMNPTFRVGVDDVDIVVEEHGGARMKLALGDSSLVGPDAPDGHWGEVLGDVDGNGQVDVFDVLFVLLYSMDSSIVLPNNGDISRGDVNGDGLVDVADAVLLLRYLSNPFDPALPANIGEIPDDYGDTISEATEVSLGSSTSGSLSEGDIDYFRVTISSAGFLTVSTTGSVDTEGAILDSSGTVLDDDDDDGEGRNFRVSVPVSAGTYYIAVEGWGADTGDYTLDVQYQEQKADETLAGATEVDLGSSTSGSLSARDTDYFRVEMTGSGILTVSTTGSVDTEGAIWDSSGTVLARDSDSGEGWNFRVSVPVSAGTYYIAVEGWGIDTDDYTLDVQSRTCTIDSELVGTWTVENADASGMRDAFVDYFIRIGLSQTTAEDQAKELFSEETLREDWGDEIRFNTDGSVFGGEDAPTRWCIEDDILFLLEYENLIPYKYFLDGDELHLTYTKAILLSILLEAEDLDVAEREIMESIFEPLDEDYVLVRIVLKRKS